jgi:hypothetical protein
VVTERDPQRTSGERCDMAKRSVTFRLPAAAYNILRAEAMSRGDASNVSSLFGSIPRV